MSISRKPEKMDKAQLIALEKQRRLEDHAKGLSCLLALFILGACWYFITHSGENVREGGRYYKEVSAYGSYK